MTDLSFDKQRWVLRQEVAKVFDYVDTDEFYRAKQEIYYGDWTDEAIAEILIRANHVGAIARITYYKFVHKIGFDPRALWDAMILEWMFTGVWQMDLDKAIKTKEFKAILKRFRYPEWVTFGLIGGGLAELRKMGDKFAAEMEAMTDE